MHILCMCVCVCACVYVGLRFSLFVFCFIATYSSLSHSLKPKLGENANGHYMLLNHPTRSNLAKGSQLVGQDLSSYSSLGESRNKQVW